MLNEIGQWQKDKHFMIPLIWGIYSSQIHKTENRMPLARD